MIETRIVEGTLFLCGEANISNAADLHAKLACIKADQYPEIVIDLSELTELDTAGVQVLVAFRCNMRDSQLRSCPACFREFLEVTGLGRFLT